MQNCFFPPFPWLCCCYRPSTISPTILSTNTHPVLCSTTWWSLNFIISGGFWPFLHGLKGSTLSVVRPFFPAPLLGLHGSILPWSTEVRPALFATKFFSGMQAHCIFELTLSYFRIGMVLLSYFLHKISKDCCLPLLWWGWRAWGGEGWLWEHGWAWWNGGGSLWICAISWVQLGSSDLQHPSAGPCRRSGSVVSPHDLSQGKAFSHGIFVEVSCIQAWRGILPSVYAKGAYLWLLPLKHFAQHSIIWIIRR